MSKKMRSLDEVLEPLVIVVADLSIDWVGCVGIAAVLALFFVFAHAVEIGDWINQRFTK